MLVHLEISTEESNLILSVNADFYYTFQTICRHGLPQIHIHTLNFNVSSLTSYHCYWQCNYPPPPHQNFLNRSQRIIKLTTGKSHPMAMPLIFGVLEFLHKIELIIGEKRSFSKMLGIFRRF